MKASEILSGIPRDRTARGRRAMRPLRVVAAVLLVATGIALGGLLAVRRANIGPPTDGGAAELDNFWLPDPSHAGTGRVFRHVSATRWIEQRPDGKDWTYDVVSGDPLQGCTGMILVGGFQPGTLFVPTAACRSRTVFRRDGDRGWRPLGEMLPLH